MTGQAFEDMQEQNSRLIQQLREKDDANFKLMSERIKANSLHKLLREEKQLLQDQVCLCTKCFDYLVSLRLIKKVCGSNKTTRLQRTVNYYYTLVDTRY